MTPLQSSLFQSLPRTVRKRLETPCRCPAYKFPHRRTSGKCSGTHQFCSACESEASGTWIDFGYGEVPWGSTTATDTNRCFVSECCEAPLKRWDGTEIDPHFP